MPGLSPEQLEAVLAHELANVRRHDFLINALQAVAETLLFYHPAIWWLSRRVRQEREHCCDDLAISICGDTTGYARMLVSIEELRGRVPQTSVAASGGSLVERVRRLLPSPPEQTRSPWLTAIMMLATLMILIGSWQWTAGQVFNRPKEKVAESQAVSDDALPASVVEEWQQHLASGSATRQARAASEIAERLTDEPTQTVDPKLISSLGVLRDQGSRDVLRQNMAKKQPSAIEALGKMHDRESIPRFIELLTDGDELVRTAAAKVLVLNPDARAIEPLIAELKAGISINGGLRNDRNNSTLAIAEALGRIGDPRGLATLVERIDDATPIHFLVEDEAEISGYPYPRWLGDRISNHPFAWPLIHAGLPALPELATGLASKSVTTRKVCAWVLDNLAVEVAGLGRRGDVDESRMESEGEAAAKRAHRVAQPLQPQQDQSKLTTTRPTSTMITSHIHCRF